MLQNSSLRTVRSAGGAAPSHVARWLSVAASALSAALVTSVTSGARAAAPDAAGCGASSAEWNVPDGAIVLSRSQGPIGGTLSGVGEYRTHSMLANGNGWVTHSTMFSPGQTGWPTYCSTPLKSDELRDGYPGASIVAPGAIYAFLYGDGGSVEHLGYQRSCNSATCPNDDGSDIASWAWNSSPYAWVTSRLDNSQGLYRLLMGTPPRPINYSLYQYRNLEEINHGSPTWNNGAVCSTFLSYAQYMADKRAVLPHTYPHDAILNAMSGLMNAVENECHDGIGFWKNIAVNVTCLESICDDAARQVANCMAVGRCDTDDDGANTFASVRDDPTSVAVSISPDRLGGWSGHPSDGYLEGSGVSVWAADSEQQVQWNSAGNVYGCWY